MAQDILKKGLSVNAHQDTKQDLAKEGTACTLADDILQCEHILLVKCPGADVPERGNSHNNK